MAYQKIRKNDTAVTFMQGRPQEIYGSTRRTDINEINKRNVEQEKQEKKSSYTVAGIIILLIVFIMVLVHLSS